MTLIKGLGNSSQLKNSLMKALQNGVPCEMGLTTVQKDEQKKQRGMNPKDVYENFNFPRRRI
ncbi:MAG: hypothetical protein PHD31_00615 [Candidatus Pacebacteria bacterium]|nr:hypothetical protein [Candidatus Paceibacterota bacterium]